MQLHYPNFRRLPIFCTALLLFVISSCSLMQDDMADCFYGVWVKLEVTADVQYGGKYSQQSFADNLSEITIWVFDENGIYINSFKEESATFKQNNTTMHLSIEPGNYNMLVWTGTDDAYFEVTKPIPGVTRIEEMTVRLRRDSAKRQGNKLPALWHGRIENAIVKKQENTYLTIELIKNTNTIITVLNDMSGSPMLSEDYAFEIIADNGYMDYDNNLLPDDRISYDAYLSETAVVSDQEDDPVTNLSVARAELNTLRLMVDKYSRFVVTNKKTGVKILNIDLVQYLLLTREYYQGSDGLVMPPQRYLDYEDIYRIIFFLSPTGDPVNPFTITELRINNWIIRINNANL